MNFYYTVLFMYYTNTHIYEANFININFLDIFFDNIIIFNLYKNHFKIIFHLLYRYMHNIFISKKKILINVYNLFI